MQKKVKRLNKTKIGELYIDLKAKTEALEKGLNTAKKRLQEIEKQNEEINKSNKNLEGSYLAMSAIAVASLMKVVGVIKDCVNEYNKYTQAMSSLKDVADYTGQSMNDFSDIMDEFSAYMTQDDLAATIKNFTLMGYSAEETKKMIEALTNSAIKNRNANYTVSQAVKVASDGYKQGLSTLSDSAGVTENLSVMLDNYAKSIGKTASQLTEAEKNQAYLNRTMAAAEPFVGAMEGYMDSLAGKQGAYSQAMRETQVAYAEALEPTMSDLIHFSTMLLENFSEFIGNNKELVVGITAFGTALLSTIAIINAGRIAMKLFNTTLLTSPVTLIVAGISTLIGVTTTVTTAIKEHKEAQEELEIIQKRYNETLNGTIELSEKNMQLVEQDKNDALEKINLLKEYLAINEQISGAYKGDENISQIYAEGQSYLDLLEKRTELEMKLKEKGLNWVTAEQDLDKQNELLEACNERLGEYAIAKDVVNTLDITSIRNKQKEAAQLKITVDQNQKYLAVIKKGAKGTKEYEEAEEALAKAYTEASSAEGIIIDEAQRLIDADKTKADSAWTAAQETINSYINIINEAKNSEKIQKYVASQTGKAWSDILPELNAVLAAYEVIVDKAPTEVAGIAVSKNNTSSYQNKVLDNYKKQIEYKKNLDKISAEEEIKMYEYALNKLAKTNDEKMDLEVEIYQLRKQLIEDFIDTEKEALDKRTENSERWIEEQNLSAKEQEEAYNRIIEYHKEYLDKMLADERLSLEQKEAIWQEEINKIKDYQAQIRDIRIETVDNTYEALKDALVEQANQLQEVEEKAVNKSLELLQSSKDKKIEMIKEEYNARIKAIDDELKALEEAEKQKNRQEEQADYEKKRKRLEELIAYEHDAVTKASYEKELAKLNEEYQKTLDEHALENKKEALSNEKESLKEEQQLKIDNINLKYEKEKEYLDNRLVTIQENYDKERELADKNAQIMLLNTEQHQDEIIELLKTYGDEYELLGTTWGERVVQAFETKIQGIVNTVQNLNTQLNNAIDSKIASMTKATTGGTSSADIATKKAYVEANKTAIEQIARENGVDMSVATSMYKEKTTIIQNNTYNVPIEQPSAIAAKTRSSLESLGELVRGSI